MSMRQSSVLIATLSLWLLSVPALAETIEARIDLSDQLMRVWVEGRLSHEWPVSTARPGYRTPVGDYHPVRLERVWYSTLYDYAPMPFSVFFRGGYAIHGTTELASLGQPASHGCVRLDPANAQAFFELVRSHPYSETLISVIP